MIKKADKALTNGKMAANTWVHGETESNMVKEHTLTKKVWREKVFGKMGKELNGFNENDLIIIKSLFIKNF